VFFSDSTLDLLRGVACPPVPSYCALLREAMEARLRSVGVVAGDSLLLLLSERRKSILALRGSGGAAGGEKRWFLLLLLLLLLRLLLLLLLVVVFRDQDDAEELRVVVGGAGGDWRRDSVRSDWVNVSAVAGGLRDLGERRFWSKGGPDMISSLRLRGGGFFVMYDKGTMTSRSGRDMDGENGEAAELLEIADAVVEDEGMAIMYGGEREVARPLDGGWWFQNACRR